MTPQGRQDKWVKKTRSPPLRCACIGRNCADRARSARVVSGDPQRRGRGYRCANDCCVGNILCIEYAQSFYSQLRHSIALPECTGRALTSQVHDDNRVSGCHKEWCQKAILRLQLAARWKAEGCGSVSVACIGQTPPPRVSTNFIAVAMLCR